RGGPGQCPPAGQQPHRRAAHDRGLSPIRAFPIFLPMDVTSLTIPELRAKFASGELKPRAAGDQLGARIAAVDPRTKAYIHLDLDAARAQADAANIPLPLGGVPIAIKDVINVRGDPCA